MVSNYKIMLSLFCAVISNINSLSGKNRSFSPHKLDKNYEFIPNYGLFQTNEEFGIFFKNFKSNRKFQIDRIRFPLKITAKSEDPLKTEYMSKAKWNYTNFDKVKNIRMKRINNSANEVNVVMSITDTGVHVVYQFKKQGGQWILCAITDYSD